MSRLESTERAFFDLVSARGDLTDVLVRRSLDAHDVARLVRGDEKASAVERVAAYADMYYLRLRDSLLEDFPRLATLLGEEPFDDLVADYLEAHPPDSPSIAQAGRHLPRFLSTRRVGCERPWLVDLADLEWARAQIFDAAEHPAIGLDALAKTPPERFATLPIRLVPAAIVLDVGFDAAELWRQATTPSGDLSSHPAAGPWRILVWRRGDAVLHQRLTAEQADFIAALGPCSASFGALCAHASERRSPEEAARLVWSSLAPLVEAGAIAAPGAAGRREATD